MSRRITAAAAATGRTEQRHRLQPFCGATSCGSGSGGDGEKKAITKATATAATTTTAATCAARPECADGQGDAPEKDSRSEATASAVAAAPGAEREAGTSCPATAGSALLLSKRPHHEHHDDDAVVLQPDPPRCRVAAAATKDVVVVVVEECAQLVLETIKDAVDYVREYHLQLRRRQQQESRATVSRQLQQQHLLAPALALFPPDFYDRVYDVVVTISRRIHCCRCKPTPSRAALPANGDNRCCWYCDVVVGGKKSNSSSIAAVDDESSSLRFSAGDGKGQFFFEEEERSRVVRRVLLPLVASLWRCYRVLDDEGIEKEEGNLNERNLVKEKEPVEKDDEGFGCDSSPERKQGTNRQQQNQKPPPPVGMLSLRNYADVAAMCECLVCTSVLPLLFRPVAESGRGDDSNDKARTVMKEATERRARFLPNSIAGRLPREALLWGCLDCSSGGDYPRRSGTDAVEDGGKNIPAATAVASAVSVAASAASRDALNAATKAGSGGSSLALRRHDEEELQLTATALGNLLLLDRFRPMLLPRHLPDLYAAVFARDQYRQCSSSSDEERQDEAASDDCTQPMACWKSRIVPSDGAFERLRHRILIAPSGLYDSGGGDGRTSINSSAVVVDAAAQACAFRMLLGLGMSTPAWLRQTVSFHLNQLAVSDLPALMAAFVVDDGISSSNNNNSAGTTALRLARTLTLPASSSEHGYKSNKSDYFNALGFQVIRLLDGIAAPAAVGTKNKAAKSSEPPPSFSRRQVSYVHAAWALLDAIPESSWQHHMLDWEDGEATPASLVTLLRRWSLLLSQAPPFACTEKLSRLAVMTMQMPTRAGTVGGGKQHYTFLSRLVCWSTVGTRTNQSRILHSEIKQEALTTLRWLSHVTLQTNFKFDRNYKGEAASSSFNIPGVPGPEILAVAFIDAMGSSCDDCNDLQDPKDLAAIVEDMGNRANMLIKRVLLFLLQEPGGTDEDGAKNAGGSSPAESLKKEFSLIAIMFLMLLELYMNPSADDDKLRLVPMVMLPRLCEECPHEALLYSSIDDGVGGKRGSAASSGGGLFGWMKIVFKRMVCHIRDRHPKDKASAFTPNQPQMQTPTTSRRLAVASLLGLRSVHPGGISCAPPLSVCLDDELLISVCSLLLSLLIGILELGSRLRTPEEEALLQDFTETLRPLASVTYDEIRDQTASELAQMASHAMALLVARRIPSKGVEASGPDRLAQIEHELLSAEAPMRARAVVTLRHIAATLGDKKDEDRIAACNASSALGLMVPGNENSTIWRMLRISVQALSDSESYVYLAAIQTIATIADVHPQEIIGTMGMALSCGHLCCGDQVDVALSPEQRAKLAEAMISVIRRKAAIQDYLPLLLDTMVYGDHGSYQEGLSFEQAKQIQERTHQYFMHGLNGSQEPLDFVTPEDEKWEDINARMRAGGPLFQFEEDDVVRAAKVNVVSELVSVASPESVARHCSVLVHCSVNSIQLDASRPVRRSGALLARSLYEALSRENSRLQGTQNGADRCIRLAVAMIEAREGVLASALRRCVALADLDDLGSEKARLYDPAMVARCQEALMLRNEVEEAGLLAVGALVQENREERSQIIQTLLEPTNSGRRMDESTKAPTLVAKKVFEEL